MSKYRVKASPKKNTITAQDVKEERKFFKVAIVVTILVILSIYLVFNYLL